MANVPICSTDDLQTLVDTFFREGCVLVRAVLNDREVDLLRALTDRCAIDPAVPKASISHVGPVFVLRRCHELDPEFARMQSHPQIHRIAEAVLGVGARFNAMNVIRNGFGEAISNWHVDDVLEFPLPEQIERFDRRIRMPVFWMTVQVALSDIESIDHGPTQYVPQSHYSGRHPVTQDDPCFEGNAPVPVMCSAGDIYLTNHQCWHRGAPNVSQRTRYVMQVQYAARWADARFRGLA